MKIMINEESSDSSISDFEENDLNIVENESTSSNESEECAYLGSICKPLYDRLKKNPKPWTEEHTKIVKTIKDKIKELPCLNIPHPEASLIVETDASDIGYGGSPSPSCSTRSMIKEDSDDIARRIRDCKEEDLARIISEIRSSPSTSEDLYQDSRDPYDM
ncbi:enzymatic polyprotein [Tanacetum coccineum]